jgi:bifunctional ADP-heptose synthase (sugar kinase/adenylyltransferase)
MASLECVSAVFLFSEETPQRVIDTILPDVLVKGGDYTPDTIVGAETVKKNGGQVTVLPFLPGYSTSLIEKKIKGN